MGPRYNGPCDEVPDEWKACESACAETACVDYWWEIFNDPCLNQLEWQAITNSPNLYVAAERVIEARALAGVSRADLFPDVDFNPSYSDTGQLFKLYLPSGFPLLQGNKGIYRVVQMQYALPLNLSYELDLWGKVRGQYESAWMTAQAQEEAYHTALLSLTTDLASAYFQLRTFDSLIELLNRTLDLRARELKLTNDQYEKGLTGLLDVSTAQAALANIESELLDLIRQRQLQENTIALLAGEPASYLCIEALSLCGLPPEVPASLPSDVLTQRPDIAQAERMMASQHRLIGVAYASFFPSIELTGTLGFLSPTFHDFLSWESRLWSMGGSLLEPIFDGGRRCANLEATCARFRQASGEYQQQVLVAFKEVEDALSNLDMQYKQSVSVAKYVDAASRAAHISRERYNKGLTNYMTVIENDSTEIDAQRTQVQLLGVRYLSTIQLIKAIGGRWSD